jgi:predicted PurR-regulated permease PerM
VAFVDLRTTRILFTILVFALALGFVYEARHTLIAFLFAIFFAYLIDPLVSKLESWVKGRGWAIVIVYSLLLVFVGLFFSFVGPRIGHEGAKFGQSIPTLLEKVSSGEIAKQVFRERGWSYKTEQVVEDLLASHREQISLAAQRIGVRVAEVFQNVWLLVVVPILAAFFLKDGRAFSEVALSLVHSKPQREFLQNVTDDLNQMLAHFIRAQLTLAALSLMIYTAVLGLMRVPYALVLGTAGGVMEFIPVVGPLVAALLIISVAMLSGYQHWVVLIVFLGAWRLIQDYVVSPRVMGERMELHPLAAIFGVLAGGEIAGVLGVYLSIPIMASLRIVWRRWQLYMEKRRFGPLNDYSFGGSDLAAGSEKTVL